MSIFDLTRAILKREEGFVPHAYTDSLGYWTIGYGRLIDRRRGGGITNQEAEMLLDNQILAIIEDMNKEIPWWSTLDSVRSAVLLSMAYQLGVPGLKKFVNTLNAVKAHDWSKAAEQMRKSKWYRQTPNRAERMVAAMLSGRLLGDNDA